MNGLQGRATLQPAISAKTDHGLVADALLGASLLVYLQAMHASLKQLMHGLLCCAVLCCAMLCCAMFCLAMSCYAMSCYAMLCCAVLQVARIVGVDEGYIGQRCRGGGAQSDASAKHARFAAACALNALLCEQSAWTVEQIWGLPSGLTQQGHLSSSMTSHVSGPSK